MELSKDFSVQLVSEKKRACEPSQWQPPSIDTCTSNHQYLAYLLHRNRISDRGRSEVMEEECGDGREIGMTEGEWDYGEKWATRTLTR
ncbi:hypothetical protein EVAR_42003_1 [Eumeta japonica]|uniref:Uncharacterized protein n=1 Tax=Eumeta variegata TaxID=151549 RepID=A0A4C1WML7_EUMVA|nr:hypothetical protein EVAR_42003_1 [Eumeta japonica]